MPWVGNEKQPGRPERPRAFSVSQSQIADVRAYIRNQREHHRVRSFQEELRALLKAYEIEYDERYLWDRRALAALQAAPFFLSFTQGIGLRPQPWAPFSRPVG